MEYLIPIVLVLLLVTGFVTFLVLNATKKSKPSEAANSEDSDPSTMAATDDASPLGDTTEHAGDQDQQGKTVEAPEGEGESESAPHGGSADGSAETPGAPRPESERMGDRHQV